MNIVRWAPLRDRAIFQNSFNRFFDEDFYAPSRENDELAMTSWNPVVDIYDNDNNIVIKAELPGMDKKDIAIDLKDRVLTLKGERSFENEAKEENYYKRERSFGNGTGREIPFRTFYELSISHRDCRSYKFSIFVWSKKCTKKI